MAVPVLMPSTMMEFPRKPFNNNKLKMLSCALQSTMPQFRDVTLASSAYIATDVSFIDSAKGTILKN